MKKKRFFVLIVAAFLIITANSIVLAGQAPMLAELVDKGELPSLKERIPEDPMVLPVAEKIGDYGGTLNVGYVKRMWHDVPAAWPAMAKYNLKGELVPQLAKDWELSEDAKRLTLYLRKGLKWSDGEPFTSDDIMFWYEDIFLNEKITPAKSAHWCPGGEPMQVEKIDDYTVQFNFAKPYPPIEMRLAVNGTELFAPKHYLKNFHINYVDEDELKEMAKEEGQDTWYDLFNYKATGLVGANTATSPQREVDTPTLTSYVVKKRNVGRIVLERNPYYWKVDPEGNQLPYIDKVVANKFEDVGVFNMQVLSGELDFAASDIDISNYPLYMEEAKRGGYRVINWKNAYIYPTLYPNHNHKDPVLKKLINTAEFKQALSLAINRKEINQLLFFGLGTPMQTSVLPPSKWYKEEFANAYVEHDIERANKKLDNLGLKWDKKHEYRLRSDGKRLSITLDFNASNNVNAQAAELVKNY